ILAISCALSMAPILSSCSDSSDKTASDMAVPVRAASETREAKVVALGPNPVTAGIPFNVQPNGQSAIWLKLDRPVAAGSHIVLAGQQLETMSNGGDGLASPVPSDLTAIKGTYPLYVVTMRGSEEFRSATVDFVVE
ncbi:MAG: hypothetical protein Q8Q62_07575, partial [Mesorhizobium sp.]|nr:hypothetical protein [Mesorhizobium sp.]